MDDYTKDRINGVIKLFNEKKELFEAKNENYGSAWLKSGEITTYFLDDKDVILTTLNDHNIFQLYGRILEKLIRFVNIRFGGINEKVGEKVAETMGDISVIALMIAEISKHEENN